MRGDKMKTTKTTTISVTVDTKKRFNSLRNEAYVSVEEFMNRLMDAYERQQKGAK